MLRYRIFFDIVLDRYRMSIHSISMFSKGLSFITNRQRRNEGTFCASELRGSNPRRPPPREQGMSACFQDLEHSISNVNSFDIECNVVFRYRRSFSDAWYRCNIVIYRYRRSDTRYRTLKVGKVPDAEVVEIPDVLISSNRWYGMVGVQVGLRLGELRLGWIEHEKKEYFSS
jgi:hypothetical protein